MGVLLSKSTAENIFIACKDSIGAEARILESREKIREMESKVLYNLYKLVGQEGNWFIIEMMRTRT